MYEFSVTASYGLCQLGMKYCSHEDNSIAVIKIHSQNSDDLGGALIGKDLQSPPIGRSGNPPGSFFYGGR